MGIGVSVFLLALGAILAFAVHASVNGLDINTIGVILMVVGVIGVLIDLVVFMPRRRSATYVQDGVTGRRTTTIDERL